MENLRIFKPLKILPLLNMLFYNQGERLKTVFNGKLKVITERSVYLEQDRWRGNRKIENKFQMEEKTSKTIKKDFKIISYLNLN